MGKTHTSYTCVHTQCTLRPQLPSTPYLLQLLMLPCSLPHGLAAGSNEGETQMQGQGGGLGFSENTRGLFPHSRPSLAHPPAWGLSLHPAAWNCGVVPHTSECPILTELLGRRVWFPVGSEMVWLTGGALLFILS